MGLGRNVQALSWKACGMTDCFMPELQANRQGTDGRKGRQVGGAWVHSPG